MELSKSALAYHEKMFPGYQSKFKETDPEFIERFDNFAFDEVVNQDDLDGRIRFMAILAALLGCQGLDEFKVLAPAALNFGVTPIELKEIVYQAVAYLGVGRVFPFLKAANTILEASGVKLPLDSQATTTMDNRLEGGIQAQVEIFGETMTEFWCSGSEEVRHINKWLTDNCFGDYYTRQGLNKQEREMLTFCFLAAQGGCETQLTAHAAANMRIGNDKAFLIKIVSQCLPYIGYPRVLNAIKCVEETDKERRAENMLISEFSKKTGVSVDTLRYYEQIGLIPSVTRNSGGIRVYDSFIEARVYLIKSLKSCGMSLDDMFTYIQLLEAGDQTIEERQSVLGQVKGNLLQKINEMQMMIHNLDLQLWQG